MSKTKIPESWVKLSDYIKTTATYMFSNTAIDSVTIQIGIAVVDNELYATPNLASNISFTITRKSTLFE